MEGYYIGALERAEALGYVLEEIWLGDPAFKPSRIAQILLTRDVSGLLLAPLPNPNSKIDFAWEGFSAVTFGYSLADPQLHMVMNHQFRNMQRVVRELRRRGYCKVGIAMPIENDERVDHNYLSGFWIEANYTKPSIMVPPFLSDIFEFEPFDIWMKRYRPDAVITATNWAKLIEKWLWKMEYKIPEDIGLAVPSIPFKETKYSGVDENVQLIGSIAVDTLAGLIHRNEKGVPQFPQRILIEGVWHEGTTVRNLSVR